MMKMIAMIQEFICINKLILLDDLFVLDRIIMAKVIAMLTPYNIFLGGTLLYLFIHCYCAMMTEKKGAK